MRRPTAYGALRGSRRSSTSRLRRASQYIEFAILLPFTMVILIFSINIGTFIMQADGLQDAAQQLAISGAQQGGLSDCSPSGCQPGGNTNQALISDISYVPGMDPANLLPAGSAPQALEGGGSVGCTSANPYVTVQVSYQPSILMPGVLALLHSAGINWIISATATARCEISLSGL